VSVLFGFRFADILRLFDDVMDTNINRVINTFNRAALAPSYQQMLYLAAQ
jgi:hypothetical protein